MNSINFYSGEMFPQYREALSKMQDMINLVSLLSGMGGQNFILSGCTVGDDGQTSDGYVVVNGELLPFVGGATKSKITIVETRQDVSAFGVVYPETYITRVVRFEDNGEYSWGDFEQIKSNAELYKLIRDITGDKPGTVKMWAGQLSMIPSDHMLCDGRELAKDDYPELFNTLGTAFGGNGISSFQLPDMRARFVVGQDNRNVDYNILGSTGGEEKHELTLGEIPEHEHSYELYKTGGGDLGRFSRTSNNDSQVNDTLTTGSAGGGLPHENRPPYIVLAYIIKVR